MSPILISHSREGGGVGDASIRKIAYFDGAKDPSLFKGNVRYISLHTCTLALMHIYTNIVN